MKDICPVEGNGSTAMLGAQGGRIWLSVKKLHAASKQKLGCHVQPLTLAMLVHKLISTKHSSMLMEMGLFLWVFGHLKAELKVNLT